MPRNINKVVYGGQTLIDLTPDTVTADKLLEGITAHDASGATITGNCDYDANTQDATATVNGVLAGQTFYGQGTKKTGTMPNRGKVDAAISTKEQTVTIQDGYHDGSGTVKIDETEQAKIIADNIKQGVQILGVTGTYGGEEQPAQPKTVTPTKTGFTVLPDDGYSFLTQVTVNAIPYSETENPQGGLTVTIA